LATIYLMDTCVELTNVHTLSSPCIIFCSFVFFALFFHSFILTNTHYHLHSFSFLAFTL
jgi:hypothetical protein